MSVGRRRIAQRFEDGVWPGRARAACRRGRGIGPESPGRSACPTCRPARDRRGFGLVASKDLLLVLDNATPDRKGRPDRELLLRDRARSADPDDEPRGLASRARRRPGPSLSCPPVPATVPATGRDRDSTMPTGNRKPRPWRSSPSEPARCCRRSLSTNRTSPRLPRSVRRSTGSRSRSELRGRARRGHVALGDPGGLATASGS